MIEAEGFTTLTDGVRIVVVDDDPAMQRLVVNYLSEHGLQVTAVPNRQGLLRSFSSREPDLIILDLHLGEDDGLDLLRELRSRSVVPVILITGNRREEIDQVLGLELGADDYLTKPFGLRELLARVRAALRRRVMDRLSNMKRRERSFRFGGWVFDQRRRKLLPPVGESIALTKSEFALLSAFVLKPRQILSREDLLLSTRVYEDLFDRSIDVQILRLRRKLKEHQDAPRFIRTERGAGYIFDVDVEVM